MLHVGSIVAVTEIPGGGKEMKGQDNAKEKELNQSMENELEHYSVVK